METTYNNARMCTSVINHPEAKEVNGILSEGHRPKGYIPVNLQYQQMVCHNMKDII